MTDCEIDYPIQTQLFVSVNRLEGPEIVSQVGCDAIRRLGQGIEGFELAGIEAAFLASKILGLSQLDLRENLLTVAQFVFPRDLNVINCPII